MSRSALREAEVARTRRAARRSSSARAAALGDDDDGVSARLEALLEEREQAVRSVEVEVDLRHEAHVDVVARERRVRGDEARRCAP